MLHKTGNVSFLPTFIALAIPRQTKLLNSHTINIKNNEKNK